MKGDKRGFFTRRRGEEERVSGRERERERGELEVEVELEALADRKSRVLRRARRAVSTSSLCLPVVWCGGRVCACVCMLHMLYCGTGGRIRIASRHQCIYLSHGRDCRRSQHGGSVEDTVYIIIKAVVVLFGLPVPGASSLYRCRRRRFVQS